MRIIHAIRSHGFAGVERHVEVLASAQARAGHTVVVIGGDQTRMAPALRDAGVETAPATTLPGVIARIHERGSADVVHAHMTAAELAAAVSTRNPIVVTRHFARSRGASPAGRVSGHLIRWRMRRQIAISQYVAAAVDGSATVVYPGVPPVFQKPLTRRPVALIVQRLQPEKNTDVAIRAFAAGAPKDWRLDIVGQGPQARLLKDLTEDLGIAERVTFLGFRDDVPSLMRTSSVLLAPCEVEGLGLSVLEAMANALSVVASRAGAHPETVGLASAARLFEPGNWRHAAALLDDLAQDTPGRNAYGEELARVQRAVFTPEVQASATDAVYEAVLS